MDSKSSSPTPDEALIPDPILPSLWMPEIRGCLIGVACIVLAIVVGLVAPVIAPWATRIPYGDYNGEITRRFVFLLEGLFAWQIPMLAALVMLWIAFLRGDRGDRYLWSAIMVFSASNVGPLLDFAMRRVVVDSEVVAGTILGLTVYCAVRDAAFRLQYGAVAVLYLIAIYGAAVFSRVASWSTLLSTLLCSLGLWAIGVTIAERAGFDPYGNDDDEA